MAQVNNYPLEIGEVWQVRSRMRNPAFAFGIGVTVRNDRGLVMMSARGKVNILLAGDLAPIGRPERLLVNKQIEQVFGGVLQLMHQSDLFIANLECPLTTSNQKAIKPGPNLKALPDVAGGLKEAGIDVLNLANNHILDFGEKGALDTVAALEANSILHCGLNYDGSVKYEPLYVTKNENKIAIISLAEREFNYQGPNKFGTYVVDPAWNILQIQEARANADIVLVLLHGGPEFYNCPSPRMVSVARSFVAAGASAVAYCHAHTVMGLEVASGVPIAYNLGNFLFDYEMMHRSREAQKGLLLGLCFVDKRLSSWKPIPIVHNIVTGCIDLTDEMGNEASSEWLRQLGDIVRNEALINELWQAHCAREGKKYMRQSFKGVLRMLPYLLIKLLMSNETSRRKFGPIRNQFARGASVLRGFITCENHREVLETCAEQIRRETQ